MSQQPPWDYREPVDSGWPSQQQPPPGWYIDPNGLQVLRWWDGAQWSSHTQPLPVPVQESRPPYPAAAPHASDGYGAFQQERSGQYRPQGEPPYDTSYASFPPAQPQPQQPDPYQPQEPKDPHQLQEWPQQQTCAPDPQPQAHRTPRRPRNRKVRTTLIGASALIGIIVVISVATSHGSPSAGNTAATSATTSAAASADASPVDCANQITAWRDDGGVTQLDTVGNDMEALGNADTSLSQALSAGGDTSTQQANLQAAASSVQTDAQTAEANLPPSCIPHLRSDLRAAFADADKAGIDSAQTVSEMGSGNYGVATADILAADKAENAADVKVEAVLADIKAYNNSNG